ncbi:unnamed protein product [Scytosiphon promiscuus]
MSSQTSSYEPADVGGDGVDVGDGGSGSISSGSISGGSSVGDPLYSSATPYRFLSDNGDGYGAEIAELEAKFNPDFTAADMGMAAFLLVLACGSLVVMLAVLVVFFQKRDVFEIRARSAYLTMLSGACMIASATLTVVMELVVLLDVTVGVHAFYMIYYFILVCGVCCYSSRTIRLAVLYNAGVRKTVPWLASERNHACICVFLGLASLGFPLYHKHAVGDGPFAELLFAGVSTDTLWVVTIGCQVFVVALYPLVWKTEDIFNIARELRVAAAAGLLVTVAGRLGEAYLSVAGARWINTAVMGFVVANINFFISLWIPIRQLQLHPLESRDPAVSKVLEERKQGTAAIGEVSPASTHQEGIDTCAEGAHSGEGLWTYERVVAIPEVSAAFEAFTRKALCQESLLFLKDVTKYQRMRHHRAGAAMGLGVDEDEENNERHLTFNDIVTRYIIDGAPDEVNISSGDKSNIVRVYEAGRPGFDSLSPEERRFIFSPAYVEVRFVLESNLMNRFITTERFKAALAEHQAEQSCTAWNPEVA